jgi:hypothetical protein
MSLYSDYHGLICTDDELEFIKPFSDSDIVRKFKSIKSFPAINVHDYKSKNYLLKKIIIECNKMIASESDRDNIKRLTANYATYGWFADLPFYDCEKIPHFLKTIGIHNFSDLNRLNFFTFDHILYQFSCILNYSYKYQILDWENAEKYGAYSWFECFHLHNKGKEYAQIYQEKYKPLWSTSRDLLGIFQDAICVFHIDRQLINQSKKLKIRNRISTLIKTFSLHVSNMKNRFLRKA